MCQVLEVAKGLEDVELFDLVVWEDDLGQVLAILQALQAPTQAVVRHIQLLQVFQLWEAPEVCDGWVAEVEGLQVGELVVEALDVDVPASLHPAQVEVTYL